MLSLLFDVPLWQQNWIMMKHAFLIMAHNSLPLLRVLLSMLDDERNDIFLHIDRKSDMLKSLSLGGAGGGFNENSSELRKAFGLSKARFFVLKDRVDVRWGNLSQIRAEYALFEAALRQGPYAYYHLLSGQDLPIKSQDAIHRFFDEHQGKEFVGINHGEEFEWDCRRKMMRYWLFTSITRSKFGFLNAITRRLNKYLSALLSLVFHRSKMDFAKGANWVSITQQCVEYIVSQKAFVLKRFNFTFCPDEFFLQTLVWNHPTLRSALYSEKDEYEGCMRLIDWKRGNPYVWTKADKEEILHSNRIFARKFEERDPDLIKWIRETFG